MAVKQYGYYLKGGKVAIVEKDTSFDNDVTSKEYGPGSDRAQWKSPKEAVSNGLEVQYTYAPTYNINSTYTYGSDMFRSLGWGSDGQNLVLFFPGYNAYKDITSLFSVGDKIYISAGRWAGVHEVKTRTANGVLTLTTTCRLSSNKVSFDAAFDATGDTIAGDGTGDQDKFGSFLELQGATNPYIFIDNAANTIYNNGIFSGTHNSTHYSTFNLDTQYMIKGQEHKDDQIFTRDAAIITDSADTVDVYNVIYQDMDVFKSVETMVDESFEVDIPDYLGKALVYYVKARFAEDMRDIEGYEYFMARFRKLVEEFKSIRNAGNKQIAGFSHMR